MSACIFGAVCPACAMTAALVMTHANTKAMNAHRLEISRNVTLGAYAIIVLDGAGWHGSHTLVLPDNISLSSSPTYARSSIPSKTSGRICVRKRWPARSSRPAIRSLTPVAKLGTFWPHIPAQSDQSQQATMSNQPIVRAVGITQPHSAPSTTLCRRVRPHGLSPPSFDPPDRMIAARPAPKFAGTNTTHPQRLRHSAWDRSWSRACDLSRSC